ncbi:MAG: helix-turn-helix domain-containing protein [Parvibaculum sp.]
MAEDFCTVEQAAARLRLHPKTVLRYLHEGRLRGTRIGKAYRIMRSDLETLLGAEVGASGAAARVTSVVEVGAVSLAASERLASLLNAAAMRGNAPSGELHISTAFDPSAGSMKIVVIGSPRDAAGLLQLIDLQLEQGG